MKRAGRGKGESKEADEIFSASCQKLLQAKKWSDGETTGKQLERKGNRARTHSALDSIVRLDLALIQNRAEVSSESQRGLYR